MASPCPAEGPRAGAVGLRWVLWEGGLRVLGCALAESMAWAVNRQQPPLTLLHNLSSAAAPSLLSQWSLGGWGAGVSLGSSSHYHPLLRGWF